jgi:uncharacterized protein with HEPN domain
MSPATSIDSLLDILELIDRIDRQTTGLSLEEFLDNADVQDATAYRILAIGEASKDLDDALKARHPRMRWHQILGMRNILAHEYFVRESEIIWETVKVALPELAAICHIELDRLGWRPSSA